MLNCASGWTKCMLIPPFGWSFEDSWCLAQRNQGCSPWLKNLAGKKTSFMFDSLKNLVVDHLENNRQMDANHTQKVGGIPTPLKNISSSIGMMTFPIYGKKYPNVPNHQPEQVGKHGIFAFWTIQYHPQKGNVPPQWLQVALTNRQEAPQSLKMAVTTVRQSVVMAMGLIINPGWSMCKKKQPIQGASQQ